MLRLQHLHNGSKAYDDQAFDGFHFRESDTYYNFSHVADRNLRLRMIMAVDMLYKFSYHRLGLLLLINGIRTRPGRHVHFYDNPWRAVNGTSWQLLPNGTYSGFSDWRTDTGMLGKGTFDVRLIPVRARVDARVCLLPQQNTSLALAVSAVWHEFTHIFTDLNHGTWNPKIGTYEDPADPNNKAWLAQMLEQRRDAPDVAIDPVSDKLVPVREAGFWI